MPPAPVELLASGCRVHCAYPPQRRAPARAEQEAPLAASHGAWHRRRPRMAPLLTLGPPVCSGI